MHAFAVVFKQPCRRRRCSMEHHVHALAVVYMQRGHALGHVNDATEQQACSARACL